MSPLVLGPLVRHVDTDVATVWVETEDAALVSVTAGDLTASTRTFAVHGHHYAVVTLEGLRPASRTPYSVAADDARAWPPEDSRFPPPVIATLDPEPDLRVAFGSCRTSVSHDAKGNRSHGIDALRAFALRLA